MSGTLEQTPAGPRLRFVRRLAHPPERVWRAITEPDELEAWFPDKIVVDRWAVGAPLRFEPKPGTGEGSTARSVPSSPRRSSSSAGARTSSGSSSSPTATAAR